MKKGNQEASNDINPLLSVLGFMNEFHKQGGMSKSISDEIEKLWNEYKLSKSEQDCSILNADFGKLGSVVIREVSSFEEEFEFKYESGTYDYISIKCNQTKRILWTDYSTVEPYNRNGGLYCDGASFEHLGEAILETPEYREFIGKSNRMSNISFAVWGFKYNDFYQTIQFGMCIKTAKVEEFLTKLRRIIGK